MILQTLFLLSASIYIISASQFASSFVTSSDEMDAIWNRLTDILTSQVSKSSIDTALFLADAIDEPMYFQLPIRNKPLLHHILNLYWTNRDAKIQEGLVELALLCTKKGALVDDEVNGEPDTITKSFLMREITIAETFINNSESSIGANPSKYYDLYSMPCNPTPLTKLLLHAHSIAVKQSTSSAKASSESASTDISSKVSQSLRSLMLSAVLEGQTPVIKVRDLQALSSTYSSMITGLCNTTLSAADRTVHSQWDISLKDVVISMSEAAARVHRAMLWHENSSPTAVANALANVISVGRNPLHMLSMSGATPMIQDLCDYFQYHISLAEASKMNQKLVTDVRAVLAAALTAVDNRGNSPIDYVLYRYGQSAHWTALKTLAELAGLTEAQLEEFEARASKAVTDTLPPQEQRNVEAVVKSRAETGGWSQAVLSPDVVGDTTRCDIEERWDELPSPQDFFMKYIRTGTPVVFRGAAKDFKIRRAFAKESFIKRYGSERAPASVIPYASSFGVSAGVVTLADIANSVGSLANASHPAAHRQGAAAGEVAADGESSMPEISAVESAPQYVFTTSSNQFQKKLYSDAPIPPCLNIHVEGGNAVSEQVDGSVALQFYLGPAGSGAPAHFHGHAANTLAYGTKKWWLFPPSSSFYSKQSALDFVSTDPRVAAALQCTQHGGDVMYVPTLWGHATLNVKQSIGVAHEFSVEPFCME